MNLEAGLLPAENQQSSSDGPSGTDTNRENDHRAARAGNDGPPNAMKRLACNPCRGRKVRCDRGQPACGRCAKMGLGCRYAGPSKPSITKADLTTLLLDIRSRLGR